MKLKNTSYLTGKNPKTIIAAALYLATKLNEEYRTQRAVANAVGVIEVTIRKRSREIKNISIINNS